MVFFKHRIPFTVRIKVWAVGGVTFASHMSLKSVLSVSSFTKSADKENAFYFSPLFLRDVFVNIHELRQAESASRPVVN